jgi:CRISPR/Cas system-associated exonuclease Cas4 (RecB family)
VAYNLPKGFLSASQINKYLGCPKQYEQEYVLGLAPEMKKPVAMAIGSTVHKYVETHIKEMLATELTPQVDSRILALADVEIDGILNPDELDLDIFPNTDAARVYAQNLYKVWYKELSPILLPSKSESKFESLVGDVPVLGYIDYVDSSAGFPEICDLKVVEKSKTEADARDSIQLAMYAIVENNPKVRFDSVVKNKTPKLNQVRYSYTPGELQYFTDLIGEVALNISQGNFPKTSPSNWMCTAKWCSFFAQCRGKYGKE